MTVRQKPADDMTSSTGREADDTLRHGENEGAKKRAKKVVSGCSCCCEGGERSVVAGTDIPAHATAGPYPGGLDFAARTSDHQSGTAALVKVVCHEGRLVPDMKDNPFTTPTTSTTPTPTSLLLLPHCRLHPVQDQSLRWMMALQPARDRHEQNVEVLVEGGRLVLHVLKAIPRGAHLLLWYSDSLARAFGVPFLTPAHIRGNQQYTCTSCQASFLYPNTLKAHILFNCDTTTTPTTPTFSTTGTTSPPFSLPSAFSPALPISSFRLLGSGPSAFHRSPPSSYKSSSACSTARTQDTSSMYSTRRPDWNRSPQQTRRTESISSSSSSNSRNSHLDRRAMTPDSSTDDSSALNLSTRKSGACSSSTVKNNVAGCAGVHQHSPAAGHASLAGSLPAAGQPIQIFNHIHPPGLPALPMPLDQHVAWRLYYPWLTAVPDPTPPKLLCASVPAGATPSLLDPRHHHHFSCHPPSRSSFVFPHFCTPAPDPHSLLMASKPAVSTCQRGRVVPTAGLEVSVPDTSGALSHSVSSSLTTSSPSCSSKTSVPLLPVPSEKEGEPLDLLPPSFFANKSRKGHLCLYCGKLYSRKYGLKIHLRTHTGYKPLKCKVCLRPFGDPSNLNKHVRLHAEGDTPYRCDYCGKVLVRRRDLERHIRSRHPSVTGMKEEEDDVSAECLDSEVDVISDTESTLDGGDQEIEVT